jgi:hypothetical protein
MSEVAKVKSFKNFAELQALVIGFEKSDLPRVEWTHAAHLAVAFWYQVCYPPAEAVSKIRAGIQAYNAAQGIQTTPEGGYHETLTQFWIAYVRHYLASVTLENHLVYLLNELIAGCGKDLPLTYYDRATLFSLAARFGWVAPDLQPLP